MAYATKYLFKWESSNGTTREIRVQKDGYSGSVIQRRLGRAPVLKKQRNGTVFGTSLEFYAECAVDGEFAEFYTSDPKAYKVLLYTGATLLWQGYVTPELYSEPDIAPPYDVQVIATDGIGELKLYDFAAQGVKTLRQMFTYLLGYTGLGTDVYLISSMKAGSSGAGALLDKTINLDYKVGDTCYEVLTYLLDTLHATITWWRGAWIVARETNVTFSSNKVRYYNTSGNSALLTGSVVTLGKMYTSDAWPVGQLTQKIDPAKKSVTIQAPWHVNDAFVNGPMDTDTGWTKTNNASWNSTKKGYNLPDNGQTTDLATVSQSISMLGMRVPMDFVGKFCASLISGQMYNGVAGVAVDYVTSGNVTYHLGKDSEGNPTWVSGSSGNTDYDFQLRLTAVDTDDANAEALSFTIPALAVGTSYPAGTLTVRIVGRSAIVFSASLDVVITKGYQDRLHIDNGARGEEGTVEIAIGRETSDIDYYKAFMQGLLLDSGSLITSFKDDNLTTATDFLSYISRDYARSFALPRIVRTGKVYLEDGVSYPPLVLSKGAVDYWLETFSWDMYEDELDISARSLPTATITVESEVIAEYGTGTASSSSSSGGGATPITPIPSVLPNPYALTFGNKSYDGSEPVTLTASDIGALTGITAAMVNAAYGFTISGTAGSTYNLGNLHTHSNKSVLDGITSGLVTNWNTAYTNNHTHSNKSLLDSMTINWDNYFGIDSDGNVYVKKDGDNPRHFYSYGAVSAGGLSTGGGTSGIDLAAMWASLQNNDIGASGPAYEHRNDKFHLWHMPTAGTGITYTTDSNNLVTGINLNLSSSLVTTALGYTPVNPSSLGTMAYASTGDYLPLSAGSGKALTGDLYLGGNKLLNVSQATITSSSAPNIMLVEGTTNSAYLAYQSTIGVYLQNGSVSGGPYVNVAQDGVFKYNNSNPFYHSGNSNNLTTTWTCSELIVNAFAVNESGIYLRAGTNNANERYNCSILSYDHNNAGQDPDGISINAYDGISFCTGSNSRTERMRICYNGNISIGYAGDTGYKLGISGTFNATTIYQNGTALGTMATESASSYLPLSVGSGKTITGSGYVPLIIDTTASETYFRLYANGVYKADFAWVANLGTVLSNIPSSSFVNLTDSGVFKLNNTDTFYHSGNSNMTSAGHQWSATNLVLSGGTTGTITGVYSIDSFLYFDGSNSRLGVGVAPSYNLDVYGNGYFSDRVNIMNYLKLGNSGNSIDSMNWGGTESYSLMINHTSTGNIELCNGGGNVLIGIRNDNTYKLYVNGSARCKKLQLDSFNYPETGIVFREGIDDPALIYNCSIISYDFRSTSSNLPDGISINGYMGVSICTGSNTRQERLLVDASGNVWIRSGNLTATGAITAGASSDQRLKANIMPMTEEMAFNIVMNSKPVTFEWNALATSLYDQLKGQDLGLVAQDIEPYIPSAIGTIFEKYKRLDYTKLIAPMLCVEKNHETRIQQLERESREKDAKIAELENTIARLTN